MIERLLQLAIDLLVLCAGPTILAIAVFVAYLAWRYRVVNERGEDPEE